MNEQLRWRIAVLIFLLSACIADSAVSAPGQSPAPPVILRMSPPGRNLVQLPDGTVKMFFLVSDKHCASIRSTNGGQTWSEPEVEFELPGLRGAVPCSLLDRESELHLFLLIWRGRGHKFAIDRCLDIWHCKTSGKLAEWEQPKRIFEGYVGSLNGVAQLSSGRIVLPQQYWVAGRASAPPTGSHEVTASYSDDGGRAWKRSPAKLTAPCRADFPGSNYGACEPVILPLKDGRAWMLMRTQTGFLYESSSRDGLRWSKAQASRFCSSSSPACLVRLADGRIVVIWNNCESPPKVNGAGVYVGRDALHAAISADEGKTWHGYREVYRDPTRNEPPPKRGDRGTAYPFAIATRDGKILLATGQGEGRLAVLRIDPQWLEETHHEDDFSKGLDGWSVFKAFGPAVYYWRDRTRGAELAAHPTKPGAKVLHVRRPDERPGDGAVWNFPIGRQGKLTVRTLLQEGFAGAKLALADRFINPTDAVGEKKVLFALPIDPEGQLPGGLKLQTGRWYTFRLVWDLDARRCEVLVDGQHAASLDMLNKGSPGVCYLRLRSTAETIDTAGLLVESVEANVGKDAVGQRQ